jgi:minor capsid protein
VRSAAHDIALHIADAGLGTFGGASGWAVSVGTAPASPDTAITVYDTGGEGPDTDQLDIEQPTIQVRVRSGRSSSAYVDAHIKQRAIRALLHAIRGVVISGSRYAAVVMTSEILVIGRDENDRFLMVANYRVMRRST